MGECQLTCICWNGHRQNVDVVRQRRFATGANQSTLDRRDTLRSSFHECIDFRLWQLRRCGRINIINAGWFDAPEFGFPSRRKQ